MLCLNRLFGGAAPRSAAEVSALETLAGPLNQAKARLRKPISVGFCASASTSTHASRVACVDGDRDLVEADPSGTPQLALSGDPVPHLLEAGQGFDVDVDEITRPLPLVPLHWRLGSRPLS
jgi:hypothetical protein